MTVAAAPRAIAAEDVALAVWNAGGVPLLAVGSLGPIFQLGDAPDPVAGWIQLLAVIGAIVAIATRPAGTKLPSVNAGSAFIVMVAAMVAGDRLPTVNPMLRRVMLLPFILVCAGTFDGFAAQLLGDVNLLALIGSLRVDQTGSACSWSP
jgi:hypothetical protein